MCHNQSRFGIYGFPRTDSVHYLKLPKKTHKSSGDTQTKGFYEYYGTFEFNDIPGAHSRLAAANTTAACIPPASRQFRSVTYERRHRCKRYDFKGLALQNSEHDDRRSFVQVSAGCLGSSEVLAIRVSSKNQSN